VRTEKICSQKFITVNFYSKKTFILRGKMPYLVLRCSTEQARILGHQCSVRHQQRPYKMFFSTAADL